MTETEDIAVTIVMPVHNEENTLRRSISRLNEAGHDYTWELIVVDDGSTDGSTDTIDGTWADTAARVEVIRLPANRGKGAAIRTGIQAASGRIVGIQDADLEYDPAAIPKLIRPILDGETDVVYGVRDFTDDAFSRLYTAGNRLISKAASIAVGRPVEDAYTCYKFFRHDLMDGRALLSDRFGIEAELTVLLLTDRSIRFVQTPISYHARTRQEGKKIHVKDGIDALATFARTRRRITPGEKPIR